MMLKNVRKLKVLFITSGNKNQISPVILNQSKSLQKKGINISFFLIKGQGILGYLKNIPKLRKFLKTRNFDIIHAHYGYAGIVACLAKKKEKVVISFMGSDLLGEMFNGHYTVTSRVFSFINKLFGKYCCNFIIIKSKSLNKGFKKKYRIIPNGVDLNSFYPISKIKARKQLGFDEKEKIVLFASNPSRPEKNFKLAVRAISLIINKKIKMIPLKNFNQKEVNLLMNACDLLLLTSFHEGSPNVIKEAMACNTPIVSTDVGDVRKVFGEIEGCFVTSFEPEDVAKKINLALDFACMHEKTNGRSRIITLGLDSNNIANKIINIYKNILKN